MFVTTSIIADSSIDIALARRRAKSFVSFLFVLAIAVLFGDRRTTRRVEEGDW